MWSGVMFQLRISLELKGCSTMQADLVAPSHARASLDRHLEMQWMEPVTEGTRFRLLLRTGQQQGSQSGPSSRIRLCRWQLARRWGRRWRVCHICTATRVRRREVITETIRQDRKNPFDFSLWGPFYFAGHL